MTSSIRFVAIPELQNEIEKLEKFSDRRDRALYKLYTKPNHDLTARVQTICNGLGIQKD
jgi:hypothetical protein